ncbi:unnamed protein product [Sympodiomycopsis kandeliae]
MTADTPSSSKVASTSHLPSTTMTSSHPILPPDLDSLLLLESPFARMPYEDLRRRLRTHQRVVEREFAGFNAMMGKDKGSSSKDEMVGKVDALIERVRALKDKLDPLATDFQTSLSTLQTRTTHLAQIHHIATTTTDASEDTSEAKRTNEVAYQHWADVRLQRMITDWLLRRGYVEAAERFVKNKDIESLTDIKVFKELFAIRASLIPPSSSTTTPSANTASPRSCSLALSWCVDNKVALRRMKSNLEFELRLQEFIELCRLHTPESLKAALAYAKKHILQTWIAAHASLKADHEKQDEEQAEIHRSNERLVEDVGRVMGLLAVKPGGWAYEDLYSYTRYSRLYETLLSAALQIHSLPPQPLLHIALSAGLSSLKVPACYRGQRASTDREQVEQRTATATGAAPTLDQVDDDLLIDAQREARTSTTSAASDVLAVARARTKRRIEDEMKNENCPLCSTVRLDGSNKRTAISPPEHTDLGLGVLAREVPWSHHSNSTIVCRITGKVIDDSESGGAGAVVLPNGRVYSRRALEPALDEEGVRPEFVTCPRTGMTFHRSEIKRVYIS